MLMVTDSFNKRNYNWLCCHKDDHNKRMKDGMFYRGMNDYFNSDKSYFLDSLDNVESI